MSIDDYKVVCDRQVHSALDQRNMKVDVGNLKIKFWIYTADGGDGSASAELFKDYEAAKLYAERHERMMGHGWGEECIEMHEIEVDAEGNLIMENPTISDEDLEGCNDDTVEGA